MLSPSARLAGLHYQVLAKDVNPLPEQLRKSAQRGGVTFEYLSVPAAYRTKKLIKLVKRITKEQDHGVRQGGGDPEPGSPPPVASSTR